MKKLLYLKDQELKQYIEKIFVGYRETISDAKKILDKYSIGIAHNKVIHLISLYEGITISELLKKLKITKQSLNRVLKDLIKLNVIIFKKNENDTRIKHVFLTENGIKLFDEIFSIQKKRIHNAFLNSRAEEIISFNNVLKKIINGKL
ncbi:MAG TPA: MarR family transcriptional regulator [Candidatus Pelagibacter bacterium]|nr:MarR family transcriptional regulator [Candidatus Pelagibacter bacterium]